MKHKAYRTVIHASVHRAATIGAARRSLHLAREELDQATSLDDRVQAAEKGWKALVTAGRAVLRCASASGWHLSTGVADWLESVERQIVGAARLSGKLRAVALGPHGGCFYQGNEESCAPKTLAAIFETIEETVDYADDLCAIARARGRGRGEDDENLAGARRKEIACRL